MLLSVSRPGFSSLALPSLHKYHTAFVHALHQRSAVDMDNNASVPKSHVPVCNQGMDGNGVAFVNHALELWHERRREWIGKQPRRPPMQSRPPVLSGNETYEGLLSNTRRFPRPVPLDEMVDFLVDVWEQEGLYESRECDYKPRMYRLNELS